MDTPTPPLRQQLKLTSTPQPQFGTTETTTADSHWRTFTYNVTHYRVVGETDGTVFYDGYDLHEAHAAIHAYMEQFKP